MKGYLYRINRDINGANVSNSFEYDTAGNIIGIYDGRGNKTSFQVNELNQIIEIISRPPFNYRIKTKYDANDNIERIEIENKDKDSNSDPNLPWITATRSYDILDNLLSKSEQVAGSEYIVTNYGYDNNDNLNLLTQPEGNQVQNVYDERNLLWETFRGYGTSEWSSTKRYYDLNGNLARVTDGNGHETTYLRDGFDRLTSSVDALGNRTEQELDAAGNVTRVVRKDASGVILSEAKYLHDELNRNYETQEWLDTAGTWVSTKSEFDKNSRVVRVVDANNHETKISYDGLGRVTKTEDHLGNKVEYQHDANSNITQIKETELTTNNPQLITYITTNEYDNLDRLIRTTNPINVTRQVFYDSRNNTTYTIDGEGNTTTNIYDGLNRLLQVTSDMRQGGKGPGAIIDSIVTQHQWDKNSRLKALIDAKGNTTTRQYDALNRLKKEILPDGTGKELFYDAADNITKIIDANGNEITQIYDDINRLTRKNILKGMGVIGGSYEEFGYDGISRMTSARNDYSTVLMGYDSLNRLLEEQQQLSGQSVKSVKSAYDSVGNRINLIYPSGKTINFEPDELNRIKQITDNGQLIANYSYAGPVRVKERTYGNNSKLTIGYDANRRITNYEHTSLTAWAPKPKIDQGKGKGKGQSKETAGIELQKVTVGFSYGYDKEDNRLYENRIHEKKGDAFLYDSIYRLTGVKYGVPNLNITTDYTDYTDYEKKEEFELDGVGNRTKLTIDSLVTNYTVNNLNQYTGVNAQRLTHDANGNTTFDGYNTLTYDYANRPVLVENAKYKVEFIYDALGRRIEKKVTGKEESENEEDERDGDDEDNETNNEQLITNYYYDGARVIEEYDEENELKRSYIYGNGIDEVLVMQKGRKQYWYHENALGSITHISNEKGEVVESYKYTAYGKVTIYGKKGKTSRKSHLANQILFTGREYDYETELYYYRARYYSPELGRFLQRDPGGYVDGMNLYEYCRNNPINFLDPFGANVKQPGGGFLGFLQGTVDFMRGMGDVISFGITGKVRRAIWGEQGQVIYETAYTGGEWAGVAWWTVVGTVTVFRPFNSPIQTVTHWDTAANIATGTLKPGSWVMTGGQTLRNFWFSGTPFTYLYRNAITTTVIGSSLKYPSGWQWVKGFLGQRIYVP